MKALSIRQPWAWAILYAGKDIENRDWQPRNPGLRFRGRVLIHAGKQIDADAAASDMIISHALASGVAPEDIPADGQMLPRGGIVGSVEIVDVVTTSPSPWFTGHYGLVLREPRPLPFVPLKGALGFFDVPDDIAFGVAP